MIIDFTELDDGELKVIIHENQKSVAFGGFLKEKMTIGDFVGKCVDSFYKIDKGLISDSMHDLSFYNLKLKG